MSIEMFYPQAFLDHLQNETKEEEDQSSDQTDSKEKDD